VNRFLLPIAAGFRAGLTLRRAAYRHGIFKTYRLTRPVVSVGNLTVGGTGKTPLVIYIAEKLVERGWAPCILTRGYGRSMGGAVAMAPGIHRSINPRQVGDEPALMARALLKVPIMVSAHRFRAGHMAETRFAVDVHILDDGFQHWALARDVDIVTLDATEDLATAALLPAGRLREPRSALARADVIVLTRTELADPQGHLESIARINPRAAVFQSSLLLHSLVDVESGVSYSAEDFRNRRVMAFCGIGNPRAFFSNLRKWGMDVVQEVAYRDHYSYGAGELRRLGTRARKANAEFLLTTEKDAVNFPLEWRSELPVIACGARLQIQDSAAFEEAIMQRVRSVRVPA
jgi:tetraacyldisaccharide 4'-kinase